MSNARPSFAPSDSADVSATEPVVTEPSSKVHALYRSLREQRQQTVDFLERRSLWLSVLRLLGFATAVVLALMAWLASWFPLWVALVPLVFFAVLVVRHDRNIADITQAKLARDHYDAGIARLEHRFAGQGQNGLAFLPPAHPYALDLDIMGEGSLFELLCTARTSSGERCLAEWLLNPAGRDEILARQAAVTDLKDRVNLREQMDLRARAMRSLGDASRLNEWASGDEAISAAVQRRLRVLFVAMGLLAMGALVSVFFWNYGLALLLGVGIVEWLIGRWLKKPIDVLTAAMEGPRSEMKALAEVLALVESEESNAPLLEDVLAPLRVPVRASAALSSLARIANWLDQYRNQLFMPLGFLLMWRPQVALSIAAWKRQHGEQVGAWLESLGRFEALLALATFAFENEDARNPEVVTAEKGPLFEGSELIHPLMPRSECVPNSVTLTPQNQLWVVSGSNMSGKSTFLRVIGINAVLAMAGAPVLATALRMSCVAVGATIRVLDSLQEGKSRFYAEISALKDVVSLASAEVPLLFLLDEIFHGTNSHDRRIGAEAIVAQLLAKGAIGLLTTHDLALARAADDMGPVARNVHFEDSVQDGELIFDYRLKSGVVSKSNALLLMRKVGLDV
ncbi:MAG: DNA mismatch repair protein MutS [Proteobacteria bacterium]|nr:DNA mismatch repair protein MutS [Pseudomonadota bacterium]